MKDKDTQFLYESYQKTIEDAVRDLVNAFHQGIIHNSMENSDYYNVKKMNAISLK